MALGLQSLTTNPGRAVFRILEDADASAAPTPADPSNQQGGPTSGIGCRIAMPSRYRTAGHGTLRLRNTAGSGTVTLSYLRFWSWESSDGLWMPIGPGTDANKGKINVANGYAFGEVATDLVLHSELFCFPGDFDYLYAELGTVGGTGTPTFTLDLIVPMNVE